MLFGAHCGGSERQEEKESAMGMGKQLIEHMRALVAEGTDTQDIEIMIGPLRVKMGDLDRYSATLEGLALDSAVRPSPDARAYLSARAAALTQGLSFLEEPLAVWELDAGEGYAQLRSNPPQRDGETITYWEVALSCAEQPSLRVARYQWRPDMLEREVLPYPATFSMMGRMANALVAAMQEEQ
jgi:hypothetical protein